MAVACSASPPSVKRSPPPAPPPTPPRTRFVLRISIDATTLGAFR